MAARNTDLWHRLSSEQKHPTASGVRRASAPRSATPYFAGDCLNSRAYALKKRCRTIASPRFFPCPLWSRRALGAISGNQTSKYPSRFHRPRGTPRGGRLVVPIRRPSSLLRGSPTRNVRTCIVGFISSPLTFVQPIHTLALMHIKIVFAYSLLAQHRFSDRFFLLVEPVFELFLQSCHGPVPNRAICVGPDEVASWGIHQ